MEVRENEKFTDQQKYLGGVDKQFTFREKEWYREKIIEMIKEISNPLILKLIYGFTKSGYEEEKAGRE